MQANRREHDMDFQQLKDKWPGLSFVEKLVAVLAIPVGLLLLILKVWGSVNSNAEDKLNKETDAKVSALAVKEAAADVEIARHEGTVAQVKADEQKAVADAQAQDAEEFYKNRPEPK